MEAERYNDLIRKIRTAAVADLDRLVMLDPFEDLNASPTDQQWESIKAAARQRSQHMATTVPDEPLTPCAWIGVSINATEGPTSTLERGEAATYTFAFTLLGLLRCLLLGKSEIKVHVQVLDIEVPKYSKHDNAAAGLLGTCQGLIECFQENDPWTPEARANAVAALRQGIRELTSE